MAKAIRTHIAQFQRTPLQDNPKLRFNLNELHSRSANVEVKRHPMRLIAWGLNEGETVTVYMAKVQSVGNPHWTLSDDCCPCPIEPSAVGNVQSLPYKIKGTPLVLTHDNPAGHIEDAGSYYFEYEGSGEVIVDHYDDPVRPKYDHR